MQNAPADDAADFAASGVAPEGEDMGKLARRWVTEIGLFDEKARKWHERGKKILRRYRDEREVGYEDSRRLNILWSNIEVLKPTVYSKRPKVEVKRRFNDRDPVARVASWLLERNVAYWVDYQDRFDNVVRHCRDDLLLVGCGVGWQRYVPHMKMAQPDPMMATPASFMLGGGMEFDPAQGFYGADGQFYPEAQPDGVGGFLIQPEPYEDLDYEEIQDDYVAWTDFGWNAGARTWEEVYAVWRKVYLTRDELRDRFGEDIARQVPLDTAPEGVKEGTEQYEAFKKACIYEIWDKSTKRVLWISKSYEVGPLDIKDDPLKREGFFPCPEPLFATQTNDTLIPVPDYAQYQDQAEEIDRLTDRIARLTKALKLRGLYAGSMSEVKRLFQDASELDLIPVEGWQEFAAAGGLDRAISWVPLRDVAQALLELYAARERAKADLYEVTGLSDIMRGSTDPNETAAAQQIKAQAGSVRVRDKRQDLQRFCREMLEIKAEIIAEHFSDSTILETACAQELPPQDQQVLPDALALLRNNRNRMFRIEVETDSTVAADEAQERADRVEFVSSITQFFTGITPIVQAAPETAPMFGEMLKFAVRGFKVGEALEASIEQTMAAVAQRLSAPQQAAPVDPNAEIKAQAEGIKAQADVRMSEIELAKAEVEASTLPLRLQADAATAARNASNMVEGGM